VAKVEGTNFQDSILKRVYLNAGKNEIKMTKGWGWIRLDALKITASPSIDENIYKVSAQLVDPYATDSLKSSREG
jgi:mannan endo-1,4-beta-mannosidase